MRAWLNLRYTTDKRARIFEAGLRCHGYEVINGLPSNPAKGDIFVTWNRIRGGNATAKLFQKMGNQVLVVENATWGNDFAGESWYHIARNFHNTAGCFDVGGPSRWHYLGVEPKPFRVEGETVVLPQRGIGSDPVKMPEWFPRRALKDHGGRVRFHPGKRVSTPLEDDLKNCGKVVTWGSGAAVKALLMGIPVISYMPNWIGAQDNTTGGREAMLERLAWAQWRLKEIENGTAFEHLIHR